MKIERIFIDSTIFRKPGFGITPKALNPINMCSSSSKFVLPMMNSKIFFVSQIYQTVITSPDSSPNNLKIAINSIPVKMGKFTDLNGVKIQRKQLNQLSEFLLRNSGTLNIFVSHCHTTTYSLLSYTF